MRQKCCRATPRCSSCPVVAMAAPRVRGDETREAILVADVFRGLPPRALPECVELALAALRPER